MKELRWILYCVWWWSYKTIDIGVHTEKSKPFEVWVRERDSMKVIHLTVEQIKEMEMNDIVLKTFLMWLSGIINMPKNKDVFVDEVFDMVRCKESPLYLNWVRKYWELQNEI